MMVSLSTATYEGMLPSKGLLVTSSLNSVRRRLREPTKWAGTTADLSQPEALLLLAPYATAVHSHRMVIGAGSG